MGVVLRNTLQPDEINLSICPFQNGEFDVIIETKEYEMTLSGTRKFDADELEFLDGVAPSCVYTRYRKVTKETP